MWLKSAITRKVEEIYSLFNLICVEFGDIRMRGLSWVFREGFFMAPSNENNLENNSILKKVLHVIIKPNLNFGPNFFRKVGQKFHFGGIVL